MINFGTSAYMKMLALNPKPQETELRKRLHPSGSGYDFHKQMRRILSAHAGRRMDVKLVLLELAKISNLPERNAAASAMNQLNRWLGERVPHSTKIEEKYLSESGLFSVKFSPDFVVEVNGRETFVHLWNTKSAKLTGREAQGTLGLFSECLTEKQIGILCLRTLTLYFANSKDNSKQLAGIISRQIDNKIRLLIEGDLDRGSKTAEIR